MKKKHKRKKQTKNRKNKEEPVIKESGRYWYDYFKNYKTPEGMYYVRSLVPSNDTPIIEFAKEVNTTSLDYDDLGYNNFTNYSLTNETNKELY